ncbi:Subtilisin-like serine germination related protease [Romboutsia ilealis]|uniref:Subtilisin-like serine germination related protease n=2 Tax=Romboutsia TaxID=1501226 RepID=A0A1V1HZJ3_9FIRM|nr:bifunctional germination protease/germinant receptor pseudoprotease CspBA [Romboutsia ilealis]CED93323.1 Subtilisin-like serine germination related protease [Romboutsia ilealis]
MDYEVIVKYNGDITFLEQELGVSVELLGYNYAIITADTPQKVDNLLNYTQIEYVEKPFILETQDTQSLSSTGITEFKERTKLTGKGTLLGLIDSGIDYNIPIFKDKDGNSKILYYWDQSIDGNPPNGFKEGTLYTNEDINKAINGEIQIPISSTSTHGTHTAGIACSVANEADMIVVRVGRRQTDTFSKSTEFMRAIKFVLDRALELQRPIAINISYGSNEGSHRGESLFEQYIDQMCSFWKNNIVVAAGNNATKAGHKRINIKNDENNDTLVEMEVGQNEKILNINIWPSFVDNFNLYLVSPTGKSTQPISQDSGLIKNIIGNTRINGVFYPIAPYSLSRRITIELKSDTEIIPGIWTLLFTPIKLVDGNVDIYLPTSEGITIDTRFLEPSKVLTVTVPGTASKVITVGSFNSRTDVVSTFSGEGDIDGGIIKPDLLAPGEEIVSYLPGGSTGALTGTSMATPHVTGVCSLLMQWGIVEGNDLFLYSQKVKSVLIEYARRNPQYTYPNNSRGYGFLDLSRLNLLSISQNNQDYGLYRSKKKIKKKKNLRQENLIPIIAVLFENQQFEEDLKKLNINYRLEKLSDDFGVLYISPKDIDKAGSIANILSAQTIESIIRLASLSQISQGTTGGVVGNEIIGANFFKENPNINVTGRGVIIGIADSGIDYLHPDFIYPDGTSKILYLWDQTKDGNPPEGYHIGTEYTNEDINRAIREKDDTLSIDEEGSGTMLSGICAGLGNLNPNYAGVAGEASLIVIKLKKYNGNYTNAALYVATEYAIKRALELNMPIVFNTSYGSNESVAITTLSLRNTLFFERGICMVSGVGNEGNTQTHTSGVIEFNGSEGYIELELSEDDPNVQIQVWMDRPDRVNCEVISPTGESSKLLQVSSYALVTGLYDFEQTEYLLETNYPTTFSGQQQININLTNAKKGIWKIKLIGIDINSGIYNAYLSNRVFLKPGTRFRESNPEKTINYPATYEDIISVGAYDTINDSIWPTSSRGPTIDYIQVPDIVAPGVNIVAPYPGEKYARISGTAPAAAYVSGSLALFLQYVLVEKRYPEKAFTQAMITYLKAGAVRSNNISYPNSALGYGLLNIRNVFDQLK